MSGYHRPPAPYGRAWSLFLGLLTGLLLAGCTAPPLSPAPRPAADNLVGAAAPTLPPVPTFTSTPAPVPTATFTPPPAFTPTATATPYSTFTPTPTPVPTPAAAAQDPPEIPPAEHVNPHAVGPRLSVAGAYANLVEHTAGHYELQRAGTQVTATFRTTRSPVQYWARAGSAPLFTVPPAFRPPYPIIRTVEGQPMTRAGDPDPASTAPRRFRLQVNPDGTVYYVDDALVEGVGYLAYTLQTVWGTTPAANDHAVLQILDAHWFDETFLSRHPPPVLVEVPAYIKKGSIPAHMSLMYVALDAAGRVAGLGRVIDARGRYLLAEVGELHHLTDLYLGRGGEYNRGNYMSRAELLEAQGWLWQGLTPEQAQPLGLYGLVGAIPAQLGQLSQLRRLNLNNNLLSGTIPPELGHLTGLETLDLTANLLTGDWRDTLDPLQNLRELQLGHNGFAGPAPAGLGSIHQPANPESVF